MNLIKNSCLITYLLLFQILDLLFTWWGVTKFGLDAEGNPIVKYVMENMGILPGLLFIKSIVCYLLYRVYEKTSKFLFYVLFFISVVYTLAISMWLCVFIRHTF